MTAKAEWTISCNNDMIPSDEAPVKKRQGLKMFLAMTLPVDFAEDPLGTLVAKERIWYGAQGSNKVLPLHQLKHDEAHLTAVDQSSINPNIKPHGWKLTSSQ